MERFGGGSVTDKDTILQILATVQIPEDYEFFSFAIEIDDDDIPCLATIEWRDIEDHMEEPIFIMLKPKNGVSAWKLLECKVIPATIN